MNFKYLEFKNNPIPYFENMKIIINRFHNETDNNLIEYYDQLLFNFISEFCFDKDNLLSENTTTSCFAIITNNYNQNTLCIFVELIDFIKDKLFDMNECKCKLHLYENFYFTYLKNSSLKKYLLFELDIYYNDENEQYINNYIYFYESYIFYLKECKYFKEKKNFYEKALEQAQHHLIKANKFFEENFKK